MQKTKLSPSQMAKVSKNHTLGQNLLLVATFWVEPPVNNLEGTSIGLNSLTFGHQHIPPPLFIYLGLHFYYRIDYVPALGCLLPPFKLTCNRYMDYVVDVLT